EPLHRNKRDAALVFRLGPTIPLSVRAIESASGRPIPSARVSLIYDDPGADRYFVWGYHDTSWGDSAHTRTDALGVASFPQLPFRQATILVQAGGYGRRHLGWRDASSEVSVKLDAEAVVFGQLLDATTGKPIEAAHVRLSSETAGQIVAS